MSHNFLRKMTPGTVVVADLVTCVKEVVNVKWLERGLWRQDD
jgi:hypothetical protein